MPRGGARVGSGRKPRKEKPLRPEPTKFGVLVGGKPVEPSAGVPLIPPEDVPAEQREFWQRYVGLALERRTLTPQTVPAFRLLCELEAEKQAVKRTIDADGRTYIKVTIDGAGQEHQELKAHPLKGDYARLAKQIEALYARFAIAPFGKPAGPAARTPADQQRAATRAQFFGGVRG